LDATEQDFIFSHDSFMVTAWLAGIDSKIFHCDEQPSDLTVRNQLTITNPQAYADVLMLSAVPEYCRRTYHHSWKRNMHVIFNDYQKESTLCFFLLDSVLVILDQETLLHFWTGFSHI
jgi:hypothetical protein